MLQQHAGAVPLDGQAGEEGDHHIADEVPDRVRRWPVSHGLLLGLFKQQHGHAGENADDGPIEEHGRRI